MLGYSFRFLITSQKICALYLYNCDYSAAEDMLPTHALIIAGVVVTC